MAEAFVEERGECDQNRGWLVLEDTPYPPLLIYKTTRAPRVAKASALLSHRRWHNLISTEILVKPILMHLSKYNTKHTIK